MHSTELSIAHVPYGLAFTIEDLGLVRGWAAQRDLVVRVVLDWTLDDVEFEELLIVARPGADRRTLTMWRTRDGIFAQTPSGVPHGFATMGALLDQVRPVRARRATWMQRLGLRS